VLRRKTNGIRIRSKVKRANYDETHIRARQLVLSCLEMICKGSKKMASRRARELFMCLLCIACLPVALCGPQVWDVDRLIRARNPGASFTTTVRPNTTWQTLRSITYNPLLEAGAVGSASVEEASLVRRVKPTKDLDSSSRQNKVSIWLILVTMSGLSLLWTTHR